MKIKNLIAVAALLMVCTSAFAEDVYVSKSGHIFKYDKTAYNAEKKTVVGTFAGVGNEKTEVTIPATVSITDSKTEETYTITVTGAETGWWNANATSGAVAVAAKVTTLSIDITNFAAAITDAAYSGLTKLATLTITDASAAGKAKTTTLPTINPTVTSLDISTLQLKALANNAFNSSKLKTVKLPATLETINEGAFQLCADLEGTIVIPAGVKTIGTAAFEDSPKADIDLSKAAALETIAKRAFQRSGITTANLNACEKLTSIGENAFMNCEKLTKLQMSGIAKGKLETIGNDAFNGTAIAAANIPATVTSVGIAAFANCKSMTQVSAMAGLENIQNYTFQNCEKLEKITISKNVKTIGTSAFEGCKALATITFAERGDADPNLTEIGNNAFKNCEALTALDLSADWFTFDNIKQWFNGCKALKEILVSKNIKGIWASTFKDAAIENLDLSKTSMPQLQEIFGVRTAENKNPLKSIILPETCQKLDGMVFAYATSLEEITIPTAFTALNAVPEKAFYYCSSLKTVNYAPTVKIDNVVFNENAFLGCTPFVHIVTNTYYTTDKTAPKNATFGGAQSDKVTTVEDKGGSGKFYAKLCPLSDVAISANDAKVYSIYVDGGIAYFQSLLQRNGNYNILKGQHVIVKTDEAKEIKLKVLSGTKSVTVDEIFSVIPADGVPTSEVQSNSAATKLKYDTTNPEIINYKSNKYIYRLTNNAATGGFGFTFFSGATLKEGQFFILSTQKPAGAARLNVVWLDENGFVEEDGATAIKSIDKADAEDGAIYNLQGVRVNAAKKGLYIKNGKKYIMK